MAIAAKPFTSTAGLARCTALPATFARTRVVRCQAEASPDASRRSLLLAGGAIAASPLIIVNKASATPTSYLEISSLSTFQRADQKEEFRRRAEAALRQVLDASDAPAALRLALHDAGTYDAATKTGGFDGSIILNSEELSRPENADLADIVAKVKAAKKAIDEGDKTGAGPISWADTIYLAGKVATQKSWYKAKLSRAETESGGEIIATRFPNPWPVELGRVDRDTAGPGRVPAAGADVEEIRQFLLQLAAKPGQGAGPFTPKPPFWEKPGYLIWTESAADPTAEAERFATANPSAYAGVRKGYNSSKATVTRTDFEVDFAAVYNKLTSVGAKFNPDAYLYRIQVQSLV